MFDGFIVLTSIFEFFGPKGSSLSIFRMLRLLRIFKLARSWNNLYIVIRSLAFTLLQLRDLIIVLLIVLFVLALLGMQVRTNTARVTWLLRAPSL